MTIDEVDNDFPRLHSRKLTKEEFDAWREWAHETEDRITTAVGKGKEAYWEMAEALYEFEDDGGWKALGYESLNEWLAQPEVGLTRSTYYRAIQMWKKFAVERRVAPARLRALDPAKVQEVLPALEKGTVLLSDALDDAEALGKLDIREKYRPSKPQHIESADGEPEVDEDEYIRDRVQELSEAPASASNGSEPEEAPEAIDGSENPLEAAYTHEELMEAQADLESAYDSGQASPRVTRHALAVVLDHLNDLPTSDSINREPVWEFILKVRATPRSRLLLQWVDGSRQRSDERHDPHHLQGVRHSQRSAPGVDRRPAPADHRSTGASPSCRSRTKATAPTSPRTSRRGPTIRTRARSLPTGPRHWLPTREPSIGREGTQGHGPAQRPLHRRGPQALHRRLCPLPLRRPVRQANGHRTPGATQGGGRVHLSRRPPRR